MLAQLYGILYHWTSGILTRSTILNIYTKLIIPIVFFLLYTDIFYLFLLCFSVFLLFLFYLLYFTSMVLFLYDKWFYITGLWWKTALPNKITLYKFIK